MLIAVRDITEGQVVRYRDMTVKIVRVEDVLGDFTREPRRTFLACPLDEHGEPLYPSGHVCWPVTDLVETTAQCQSCGIFFREGPTQLDRERFARRVCGGCQ